MSENETGPPEPPEVPKPEADPAAPTLPAPTEQPARVVEGLTPKTTPQFRTKRKRRRKTSAKPPVDPILRPEGKTNGLDWEAGLLFFLSRLKVTYGEVAALIGTSEGTVRQYASENHWQEIREKHKGALIAEVMRRGRENAIEAGEAILELEWNSGSRMLGLIEQVERHARVIDAVTQKVVGTRMSIEDILKYGDAIDKATRMMRRALGLPTDFHQVQGPGGGPIPIVDFSGLSLEEIRTLRKMSAKVKPIEGK